ncbi:hypothetical protein A2U01_0079788, partial [Trifolium medium]|nr:hypothetical protein [Trifolium medium]
CGPIIAMHLPERVLRQFGCRSARYSGSDFSSVCPVLGPGVDSRAERARCYLSVVRCA